MKTPVAGGMLVEERSLLSTWEEVLAFGVRETGMLGSGGSRGMRRRRGRDERGKRVARPQQALFLSFA